MHCVIESSGACAYGYILGCIVIKDILVLGFYCYNGIGTSLLSEVRHILVSEVG